MSLPTTPPGALDRARRKAYRRLLPLIFFCYVIAYVDRVNVGFAKLNMQEHQISHDMEKSLSGGGKP